MELDQSYNGAADWNFPSPGATPTAGHFNQNALHTPKTATYPSHFFHDAFSTPQMPGYTTPRQADHATMTPLQRHHMAAEVPPGNYYAHVNAQPAVISGHGQAMLPPGHAMQQSPVLNPAYNSSHGLPQPETTAMSFDTSQMQTPPPTRGTSFKRLTPQQVAFGTPSTIASRRFMTPQQVSTASQHMQSVPQTHTAFPQLQFSPDVYQFGNLGPASAPVYPQSQLLWEQTASPAIYNQQQLLDDPFAPATSGPMQWPALPVQQSNVQAVAFDTPAMSSFPVQPPMQRPASAAPVAQQQTHLSPPVLAYSSVDPSLVYSSPARPVLPSNAPQSKPRITKARPEMKRKDSGKIDHQRTGTLSSTDSVSDTAPKEQLRRSNTTGAARPHSAVSSAATESFGWRNGIMQPPRTASPLKRVGKVPMGSISESRSRSRPSVVLTVDETGRARTETRRPDDSPTRSIRDRYPGLFDSDSSDDESEEEEEDMTPSRSASFSFAKAEQRKSKAAKLDSPVENLEGLSIPRSASSASMKVTPSRAAIAAAAQLRRGGSLRKQTPTRGSQRRGPGSNASSIDTCPMDLPSERWQSFISAHESNQEQEWSGSTLDAHNRRWSMMSEQQQSTSPSHQFAEHLSQQSRYSHMPTHRIRCSCGIADGRGQSLVQCHSCTQWSHAECIGYNPSSLPSSFTCFLCTKPTSSLLISKPSSRRR